MEIYITAGEDSKPNCRTLFFARAVPKTVNQAMAKRQATYGDGGGNGGLIVMRLPTGIKTPPVVGFRTTSWEPALMATAAAKVFITVSAYFTMYR